MEQSRELILLLSSVLKWEKKFYPGVIFGAITILYLTLYYLDLSLLTLIGVIGLFAVIIDYGYPMVSKMLFSPENWTGAQEKAYEEVINEIVAIKLKVCGITKYACVPKEEKTLMVSGFGFELMLTIVIARKILHKKLLRNLIQFFLMT